ncbi:serine hydrolase domain-containing protein [Novosphingobium sp.]|uniref:serine hydrolase domain-containing protein n=1 Tax=Novosphingobium sp. TaxID=1874826 RepID=UPI001D971EB4|nr:serine hydrolase domain-containing protein [Novosphingobium sp.]MBX9664332.1 beta-lactamase family protein [Novosphingobium sp.]
MQDQTLQLSRRSLLRSAGWLGAGLAGSALMPGRLMAQPTPEQMYPALTNLVYEYVASGKLAGAVAALGWGSNAPMQIARGTVAFDSATPVDLDSLYRIYSMTKPVTGMAAMMLVDEGKIGLDQPISDFLPKFAQMQVQVTPDGSITDLRPAQTAITLRHLLTHTAGLGYTIIQKGPIKDAYEAAGLVPARVSRLPIPVLGKVNTAPSLTEFADKLAEMPLIYEPGTKFSYSVSLDLVGRLIEVVSGQTFEAFLAERLFGPCGMASTLWQVGAAQAPRLTTNYFLHDGKADLLDPAASSAYLDPPAFAFGGAGLVSSPRDYDRFLMMLAGGGQIGSTRVMSEAAVRLGTSNLLPATVNLAGSWIENAGYGAGGRVGLGADAGTYGWSGAAGTIGFVNTRIGLRAGLFVQFMPSMALPLQEEFPKAVLTDISAMKKAA